MKKGDLIWKNNNVVFVENLQGRCNVLHAPLNSNKNTSSKTLKMKTLLTKAWRFLAKDYIEYKKMKERCIKAGYPPPENPFKHCKSIFFASMIAAFILSSLCSILVGIKSLL